MNWRTNLPHHSDAAEHFEQQPLPPLADSMPRLLERLRLLEEILHSGQRPPVTRLARLRTAHVCTLTSDAPAQEAARVREFYSVAVEMRGRFTRYIAVLRFRPLGGVTTCTLEHKEVKDFLPWFVQGIFFWLFSYTREKENEKTAREMNPDHKSSAWGTLLGAVLITTLIYFLLTPFPALQTSGHYLWIGMLTSILFTVVIGDSLYRRKRNEITEMRQAAILWMLTTFDETMGQCATGQPAARNAATRGVNNATPQNAENATPRTQPNRRD